MENTKQRAGDLKLFLVLMICPELVAGDGQGDQVEQGGYPAVEGGLLVARVQGRGPLRLTPLLARLTAHRAFTGAGEPRDHGDTLILMYSAGQMCT